MGLAAALIWLIVYITKQHAEQIKFYGNHTNEVLDRNSEAFIEVAKSNQKLCDSNEKLCESHDRLCEIVKELKK